MNGQNYLCFLIIIFITACNVGNQVETIAVVTEQNFISDIYIFFGQEKSKGKIHEEGGKTYFIVESTDQVFFVEKQIGKGHLELYTIQNSNFIEVYYSAPQFINYQEDSSYQVVGGSLRGFYDTISNRSVDYITFRANKASFLKDNWEIDADIVIKKYYENIR